MRWKWNCDQKYEKILWLTQTPWLHVYVYVYVYVYVHVCVQGLSQSEDNTIEETKGPLRNIEENTSDSERTIQGNHTPYVQNSSSIEANNGLLNSDTNLKFNLTPNLKISNSASRSFDGDDESKIWNINNLRILLLKKFNVGKYYKTFRNRNEKINRINNKWNCQNEQKVSKNQLLRTFILDDK